MNLYHLLLAASLLAGRSSFVEYRCDTKMKVDPTGIWPAARLGAGQWHILIEDHGSEAFLSRCSYARSQGRVTCDRYAVDHIESDPVVGHKKYYVFDSQFDVQVFADLTFVENSGRGSVSYGSCRVTAP